MRLCLIVGFSLGQESEVDKVVHEYEEHLDETDQHHIGLLQKLRERVRRGLGGGLRLCSRRQRLCTRTQCDDEQPQAGDETDGRAQQQIVRPKDRDHQGGSKATEDACRQFTRPDEAEQPLALPHIEQPFCQAPKDEVG